MGERAKGVPDGCPYCGLKFTWPLDQTRHEIERFRNNGCLRIDGRGVTEQDYRAHLAAQRRPGRMKEA